MGSGKGKRGWEGQGGKKKFAFTLNGGVLQTKGCTRKQRSERDEKRKREKKKNHWCKSSGVQYYGAYLVVIEGGDK